MSNVEDVAILDFPICYTDERRMARVKATGLAREGAIVSIGIARSHEVRWYTGANRPGIDRLPRGDGTRWLVRA
jgi:hypothetical protein